MEKGYTREDIKSRVVYIHTQMERLREQLDVAHMRLLEAKKATISHTQGTLEATRKRNFLRMQYRSLYYIKSGLEDILENLSY